MNTSMGSAHPRSARGRVGRIGSVSHVRRVGPVSHVRHVDSIGRAVALAGGLVAAATLTGCSQDDSVEVTARHEGSDFSGATELGPASDQVRSAWRACADSADGAPTGVVPSAEGMFFRLAGPGLQGEDGLKPDQHLDVIGDDAWIVTQGEEQSRQVACPALRTALEDQFEGHTE